MDIFVLFYNRANITAPKTRKKENISFSPTSLKLSAGNQPIQGTFTGSQRCPLDRSFSVITRGNTRRDHPGWGGGALAMMGYPEMCHFHEYTFRLKILDQDINSFLKKF